MTDHLRSALAAGDTPAGVDVAAVRARAQGLRRRRTALAAAAAVTALAVAVPVAQLGSAGPPPPAAAPGQLSCPDQLPDRPQNTGPGLAAALVPFAPEDGLVCAYTGRQAEAGGPLTAVAPIPAAELEALLDRVDSEVMRQPGTPCTDDFGYPYLVQVAGAGRVVTLRLEPYGCGMVTNGERSVAAAAGARELLRSVGQRAAAVSQCPERLDRPPAVPPGGERPGAEVLPADTSRLLLCRYGPDGVRQLPGKQTWNAVLETERAREVVAALNTAPPPGPVCTRDAGPLLVLLAVTPDGVVKAVADAGGCGAVDNGVRQVAAKELVGELARSS